MNIPPEIRKFQRFEYKRELLSIILKKKGIKDERVLTAIKIVPRHLFVPEELEDVAYEDEALPIGYEQTISQPYIVAIMTESLELKDTDKVLEIGTGSGYQTSILALIAEKVITIEYIPELSRRARTLLQEFGFKNIKFVVGDGTMGYEEEAPYDKVIITAAVPEIPRPIISQTKDEGIIVAPIGEEEQKLFKIIKLGEELKREYICDCRFVKIKK